MRVILYLAGIVLLSLPGGTFGQTDKLTSRRSLSNVVLSSCRNVGLLTQRVVTVPFRASTTEWIGVGALAAVVAFAAAADEDVRSDAAFWNEPWMENVDDVGHTFQNTYLFLGTTAAFYVGGYAAARPTLRRIGQELVVAFTVAAAGTQLIKHSTGRARPEFAEGSDHFVGPTLDDNYLSLWSGDVTKAFVLASVLSEEIKHPAATIALYGLASATAFQRIHTHRHWLSDVVSAAIWSTAVGIGTVRAGKHISMTPAGFSLNW